MLSPAIAPAHATTAAMKSAAAGPIGESAPIMATSKSDETSNVAMVTPEIGLFDAPTSPDM